MRKYLSILLAALMAMALLSGCSGSGDTGEEAPFPEDELAADEVSGIVSLASSAEDGGKRIWFETDSISGRNTKIMAAYIFEDGKVTTYAIGQKYMYKDTDALGYLEDYYSLSTEETIDLIKEKHEEAHRAYYEELVDRVIPGIEKDAEAHSQTTEEEPYKSAISAVQSTYDELKGTEFTDKTPESYEIYLYKDSSGNGVESEEFTTRTTYNDSFDGWYGSLASDVLYHVVKGETADVSIEFQDACDPFEVYDAYYGGFRGGSGDSRRYLITKCDGTTEFVLDELGTAGTTEQ